MKFVWLPASCCRVHGMLVS